MYSYSDLDCPICGKQFKDSDDIVVCPICGAPYHRECYNQNGSCIFDELHSEGKSWEPPLPTKEEDTDKKPNEYEIKDKECPSCGVLNAHSSLFCSHCGSSLSGEPQPHINRPSPQQNMNNPPPPFPGSIYGGMPSINFDPMGGVNATETIENGISYGEVSKLVQQNTRYYLPVFRRIKQMNKGKFNFAAFIFSGGWLLYRKQYKTGTIVTLMMFALYLGQTFLSNYISYPILLDFFARAGVDSTSTAGVSSDQLMAISVMLMDDPLSYLLVALPLICSILMFVVMLVVGLRANRMYMKHCVKTINKIKSESNNSEDYDVAVLAKGGVNTSVTFMLVICYFLCTYLPMMLI